MKTIKQQDEFGCVIACLAMATGKTYKQVRNEVARYWDFMHKDKLFDGMSSLDEALLLYKFGYKSYTLNVSKRITRRRLISLLDGTPAILSVPSLNYKGKYHAVYWDGKKLHDPSTKKNYTKELAMKKFVSALCATKLVKSDLCGIDGGL